MMAFRLTYKILVDPNTFDYFVQEIGVPVPIGSHALRKRRMELTEVVNTWTKDEFIKRLTSDGYGGVVHTYIEKYKVYGI